MTQTPPDFSDDELLRYSRHILLDEVGIEGQRRLAGATALVVGLGGLGSPAALYLASAGVGRLLLADADVVELTNLQRQIVHRQDALGQAKVDSARATLATVNPLVEVVPIAERLAGEALAAAVAQADVVLDCSDNFPTRHAVNRACVAARKPLVSGAAVRFDGQFAVFDPRRADSPCYRCLFDEDGEASDGPCATFGVFAPLVGIVGAMQAAEALKLLIGMEGVPLGRLLTLDLRSHEWRSLRFRRDPACPVCAVRGEA
ncbi:HesA/MoeB/ThiF family protein [Chitinimonas koreensis]|uniref:HesA/MoeB/ThiF family protein n=1 Tax=Chitinimonas koreensis TaxID=356302 RepID=UPI00048ABBC6|nr:HesA/MoeB/ThiF family protein [Chitinimonas koreensis]QNM97940.1 HesA/MoeB/ThiF family protein [Chitinimonas koreensis]